MYLVDTSVWIDYIRGGDDPHVSFLRDLLSNPVAVYVSDLIYMEILQGARDAAAYVRLRDYFRGQQFVAFEQPLASHEAAARMYLDCRRHGVTVRSSVDCLIAQTAVESDLTLLHHDRDFMRMGAVVDDFRQRSFLH